ncbi:MAG: glycosyltransferase [Anaerolineae bacterium]
MNIHIVIAAYALADELVRSVESATSQRHNLYRHLFLHSHNPQVIAVCEQFARRSDTTYYPYGINRGLSKSWNQGMIRAFDQGADAVMFVNDDCVFEPGDLDTLVEYAYQHGHYLTEAHGFDHRHQAWKWLGMSCCVMLPVAFQRVGCFDENFFPAYYEDIDYKRRADLLGLRMGQCSETHVQHLGAASVFSSPALTKQFEITFAANDRYYQGKWGGAMEAEQYPYPFNNPSFDSYIAPSLRSMPYGHPYDRTDWQIVAVD